LNDNYPLEEKRVLKFGAKKYAPDKDFKEKSGEGGTAIEHLTPLLSFFDNLQTSEEDVQLFDKHSTVLDFIKHTNHRQIKKKKGNKI